MVWKNPRTRSRKPASIGSNHSSRRPTPISAFEPRTANFVLLLVMAWSPPANNAGSFGFQHPETTPPLIPTTLRTAPRTTHDGVEDKTFPKGYEPARRRQAGSRPERRI